MQIPVYSGFITSFEQEILEPILNSYVFNGYHQLANHLRDPLGVAIVLFIALLGLSISQGWIKLTMGQLTKAALKIGLIYTFALNWDVFSRIVVMGISGGANEISGWLVGLNPIHLPGIDIGSSSIDQVLQSVLDKVVWSYEKLVLHASWRNWGPFFSALVVLVCGGGMVLVGFVEIVIAKIMMAILFTLAPIFITFTLFKPTQGYFDRWLGSLVGYSFVLIFVSAMLSLTLTFLDWALLKAFGFAGWKLTGYLPAAFLGILGICLLLKVAHMALSIGGSISTGVGTGMLAGAVGGVIGSGMTSMRLTKGGVGRVWNEITSPITDLKKANANSGNAKVTGIKNSIRGNNSESISTDSEPTSEEGAKND